MTIDHEPGTGTIGLRCGGYDTSSACSGDVSARLARLQNETTSQRVVSDNHPATFYGRLDKVGSVRTSVRDHSGAELRDMYGGVPSAAPPGAAGQGGVGNTMGRTPFSGLATIGHGMEEPLGGGLNMIAEGGAVESTEQESTSHFFIRGGEWVARTDNRAARFSTRAQNVVY